MQEALYLLEEPIGRGLADHAAWGEITAGLALRAKLVESEQRQLEKLQATLTVEEAMGLLGTVGPGRRKPPLADTCSDGRCRSFDGHRNPVVCRAGSWRETLQGSRQYLREESR